MFAPILAMVAKYLHLVRCWISCHERALRGDGLEDELQCHNFISTHEVIINEPPDFLYDRLDDIL